MPPRLSPPSPGHGCPGGGDVAYKPIPEPDFENRGPLVGDAEKAKDQILPQGGSGPHPTTGP